MRSPEGAKYPIWAYFAALWRQNYKRELDDLCGRFLHSRPSKNTFLGLALTFTVFEGGPPQKPCVARTKIVYRSKFSGEILFQLMFCLSNIAVLLYNLVLNFDFHARPSYKLNKICYCKVEPFIHIEIFTSRYGLGTGSSGARSIDRWRGSSVGKLRAMEN